MRVRMLAVLVAAALAAGCVSAPVSTTTSDPGRTTTPATTSAPTSALTTTSSASASSSGSDPYHWHGVVDVQASVYLVPWQTLTIDPGTVVRVHKLPDGDLAATPWIPQADAYIKDHNDPTGHTGYASSHPTIFGRIVAVGTQEQPIVFTSASDAPGYADWNQLNLQSGSRLENVTVEDTHDGINVQGDDVVLRNVVSREALWSCIDVFGANVVASDVEAYHCWHQAVGFKATTGNVLTRAYLHDAQVAVNCELGAQPALSQIHVRAAFMAPACPAPDGFTDDGGSPDVAGGTYAGVLVYPAGG